jgi:hypothetical protein
VEQLVSGVARTVASRVPEDELHASVVEVTNEVAGSPDEGRRPRRRPARGGGGSRARERPRGGRGGLASDEPSRGKAIAPEERYREFVEYAGPTARRQGVSGLHVPWGCRAPTTVSA